MPPSSEQCEFSNASNDGEASSFKTLVPIYQFFYYTHIIPIYKGTGRHIQKTAMFIGTAVTTSNPTI